MMASKRDSNKGFTNNDADSPSFRRLGGSYPSCAGRCSGEQKDIEIASRAPQWVRACFAVSAGLAVARHDDWLRPPPGGEAGMVTVLGGDPDVLERG
jgi:hypothetical protein